MSQQLPLGKKFLLTCDFWFYAPDGKQYRAVFGTIKSISNAEHALGIKVNSRSADWFIEIGNMVIAGCQIHFAIRTDDVNTSSVNEWKNNEVQPRPSEIYYADEE